MSQPRRPRAVVFPSPVVMLSVLAMVMAALAFVLTRGEEPTEREVATPSRNEQTSAPAPTEQPTPTEQETKKKPKKKPIERAEVFVEVYNNSGISGLAASVAGEAGNAGWNVVAADNWYGSIPANTVYYPEKLKREGKQLALDLGIDRTAPAVDPMKLDRLTIILTGSL